MLYKILNALSERHLDDNGYLFVEKSPILKTGILEYYGSELLPEGETEVDGVKVDPDKIYKVFIPEEELRKGANSFKLKPITDDHTWLGNEGEDAKEYQVGTIGENVYVEDGFLYAPLEFTGKEIVEKIMGHEKEELSSSYYNRFEKSDNSAYDFIAREIKGNHLALVDRGRCGSTVRVLNSIKEKEMANTKTCNEAILKLDGKEINLDQFFEEEKNEIDDGVEVHEDSISENEVVDKRALIDEVGGMLKDKVDEELLRTVLEKLEKIAYDDSESKSEDECAIENEDEINIDVDSSDDDKEDDKDVEVENEDVEEKDDEEEKTETKSMNSMITKISNSIKAEQEKSEKAKVKAYNSARAIVGDFNPFGLSCKDMYVKALNHLGVELDGKETDVELGAMLKACSSIHSKVDNSFNYGYANYTEEKDFNI